MNGTLVRVEPVTNGWAPCPQCNTTGNCFNCGGSGQRGRETCTICNGTGNCLTCGGSGQLNE